MRTRSAILALLLTLAPLATGQQSGTPSPDPTGVNRPGTNPNIRRMVVSGGAIHGSTSSNMSVGLSYEFPDVWRAETPVLPKEFKGEPAVVFDAAPSSASKSGI